MKEKDLVSKIKKRIKERGGLAIKYHGGMYSAAGVADVLICHRGLFAAAEVKLPGRENTLTDLQEKFLSDVGTHGGMGSVVTSIEQIDELMDAVESRYNGRI